MKCGMEKYWKKLWSLEVLEIVKSFMWKACKNVLPMRQNLYKKHVLDNFLCMVCKQEEEIVIHVLWRCIVANDIRVDNTNPIQKSNVSESNFLELWKRFAESLTESDLKWVAIILRKS